jgi:hypothetical protein
VGYDMYVKNAPTDHEHNYLRRNIFGMFPTVEAMVGLGMAQWTDCGEFPSCPSPYETHVGYDENDQQLGLTDEGKRYLEAVEQHLVAHVGDQPVIPSHKFTTNDGWHVTKDECTAALAAYDAAMAAGKPHPEDWFRSDLIPFLRLAAEFDGFEVH